MRRQTRIKSRYAKSFCKPITELLMKPLVLNFFNVRLHISPSAGVASSRKILRIYHLLTTPQDFIFLPHSWTQRCATKLERAFFRPVRFDVLSSIIIIFTFIARLQIWCDHRRISAFARCKSVLSFGIEESVISAISSELLMLKNFQDKTILCLGKFGRARRG